MLGVSTTMVQSLVDKQELIAWKTRGGHRRIALQSILDLQSNMQMASDSVHKLRRQTRIVVAVESPQLLRSLQSASVQWRFPFQIKWVDSVMLALLNLSQDKPDMLIAEMVMARSQQEGILAALTDMHAGGRRTAITFVAPGAKVVDKPFGESSSIQVVPGPLTPVWLEAFLTGVQALVL